ncbi:LytTR family DNA-binding domain-containing protein [Nesterenkonia rhizosphaerae]|uniref:LytTR family DNA-binding domain-containing protein n=1 Tax=Nesterenkonia rhizosphaerae TaxID=1348272 RepID=A0ABP9FPM6_9MICC
MRAPATRPLSVLVVDDEPLAVSQMRWLLEAEQQAAVVHTADSAAAAEQALRTEQIDVVLLDIHMPETSGLELARRLRDTPVIFVTADAQPAVEAFELEACDYLLKPVRAQRLSEALRRASAALTAVPPEAQRISVLQGDSTVLVDIRDIRWVQAHGDYARLHTVSGSYLLRAALSDLEQQWEELGFLRIHRSYLVNIHQVRRLLHRQSKLSVDLGDVHLEVSRRLAPAVRRRLEAG